MQRRLNLCNKRTVIAALLLLLCWITFVAGCGAKKPAKTTPGDSGASFKFIVCGDPQNNYEVFDRVLEAAKSVDFLIIAGDLTGGGTPTEFQNFMNKMKASNVRYYCVPGNHDVATSNVSYASYVGQTHGSFDFKNCHFLLIDNSVPSLGFSPGMRAWAAADLKAAKAKGFEHTFAVAHVPPRYPYSSKASREQIAGINANENLAPVLSAGGVEELFCGHLHRYEKEKEGNLLITITGGAGGPLLGMDGFHHYVLVEINGRRRIQTVVKI